MEKKNTEEAVNNDNIEIKEASKPKKTSTKSKTTTKPKTTTRKKKVEAEETVHEKEEDNKDTTSKVEVTEEVKVPKKRGRKKKTEQVEEAPEVTENKLTEIDSKEDILEDAQNKEENNEELQIDEEEIEEIINEEEIEDPFIIQEDTVQKDLDEIADNKNVEQPIHGKRIKIPLVGLILGIILIVAIIVTIVTFKDKIFKFKESSDKNAYSDQLPVDNDLNEEEKIGYDLITKWLDGYKDTSLEITDRIFSYTIKSVSLNSKNENKFIILASYDIEPASIDSSIWFAGNGEKQDNIIKNKLQYFVIEKIQDSYQIVNSSTDKPDINDTSLTEEKAILLIKNDFPDPENLNLLSDSNMIDELTEEQKNNVLSSIGGTLDDFYKITGTYRKTFILGTFLINKQNSERWFVDENGVTTKLSKATQILNVANFEVQGDLTITQDQAIFIMFNGFPKNKRKALSIVENWIDNIENQEKVKETLGEIAEYYGLKTSDMTGIIAVKKNGLSKYFISKEGEVIDLVGTEDITTIIK